ncbi:MAG: TIR domain-containing protein [Propionibacteriaceae bacterium]|nr:TIR domain-containing protein [Propionibacteriaceae bacterium]
MAVFYSFHYDRDSWRVQQIINMGVIEGQPLLNSQDWEAVRRRGDAAIKKWIDEQMKYKQAVVVLIGAQTASRRWVLYEIGKAWEERRPLVGVRIHGLKDANQQIDYAGTDPFTQVETQDGYPLSTWVPVFNPSGSNSQAVHASIKASLASWVTQAYKRT